MKWVKTFDMLPPMGTEVHTKIEDEEGTRYVCDLTYAKHGTNKLWWDNETRVYYTPTHWSFKSKNIHP